MQIEGNIISLLLKTEGLLNGHFALSSGLHSGKYLQCAKILQYPIYATHFGASLAQRFKNQKVDAVIGPAIGGIIIAYEVARALGVRALFAEREEKEMRLRRGFEIKKGERIIVVEDVITTGGSVREVVQLVQGVGGEVVGIGALLDRSEGITIAGIKPAVLSTIKVETYDPQNCPMCKDKMPLVKPGSKQQI
ncbi:orotate phosphoribosyltransferase [bacterium]|nr:orotate phosphoribosyltransferase [bacterium]